MSNGAKIAGSLPLPRTSGAGSLRVEKGMLYMEVQGTHEEIGRAHGELVKGIVDEYIVRYYAGFIEKLIAHSAVSNISRTIPPRVARLLYFIFHKANRKRIGDSLLAHTKGFTAALGLPSVEGERIVLFPDILHFLAGKSLAPMAMPGCSAFYARDAATHGGKQIIGRNFDFFGRGLWDEYQCVKVFRPKDSQAFMWIGALGLPVGGFAMNESGICVMPFTNFMKDVGISGRPLFAIIQELLENAFCLDDAVRIMEQGKRIGGLSLMICDTHGRDACAVGFTARRMEVIRPEEDFLIRTNHHLTDKMKEIQVAPTAWYRHSSARYMRIEELLREKYGKLTLNDAVGIMSDTIDPREKRKSLVGDIVAAMNNAMSIVLSPDDDAIFISNGLFPVCHGDTYIGFRLSAMFSGKGEVAAAEDLPGSGKLNDIEKEAVLHYEEAWTEYLDRFDSAKAVYHLRRAAELAPEEPIFDRMAGLFLMKQGKYEDALPHLRKNADAQYKDARMKAESLLWLARCGDLAGRREQALGLYSRAIEFNDKEISIAAERGIVLPYSKKQASAIDMEFIVGNPIVKF
jgi:hypothetical protein